MRDRVALQIVFLLLALSLTGCQLLSGLLGIVQALLPYLVGLFMQLAPLAAAAAKAEPPRGLEPESAVVQAVTRPEELPALRAEALYRMARARGSRSVALVDLRKLDARQIQRLVRRLEAAPGAQVFFADATPLLGSPAARQALVDGLARERLRLLDDGGLARPGTAEQAEYQAWRRWLDQELGSAAR